MEFKEVSKPAPIPERMGIERMGINQLNQCDKSKLVTKAHNFRAFAEQAILH
jgi:hypothetical protein